MPIPINLDDVARLIGQKELLIQEQNRQLQAADAEIQRLQSDIQALQRLLAQIPSRAGVAIEDQAHWGPIAPVGADTGQNGRPEG